MLKLSSVYIKRPLVCFVRDAVLNFSSKHHLGAIHKVLHNVLKSGQQCFLVHDVEVNFSVRCQLNPHITFDVKYESSHVN